MSRRAQTYYTSTFTMWRVIGTDRDGYTEYSDPVTMKCQFEMGSKNKYTDNRGQEFQPMSTIWTELRDLSGDIRETPQFGDIVFIGTSTAAEPPAGTFAIRSVIRDDVSIFGQIPDYTLRTG